MVLSAYRLCRPDQWQAIDIDVPSKYINGCTFHASAFERKRILQRIFATHGSPHVIVSEQWLRRYFRFLSPRCNSCEFILNGSLSIITTDNEVCVNIHPRPSDNFSPTGHHLAS